MPKPNTKVRSDQHGLYVRAGGYVFRPQPNRYTVGRSVVNGATRFSEGDPVRARHIGGSPVGRVGDDDGDEFWSSHGTYFGNEGQIPSEQVWRG